MVDHDSKLINSAVGDPSLLIPPYGDELVDLIVSAEARQDLESYARQLDSVQISMRSVCDLELLATGAFSPLNRFVGKRDYQSILDQMRLATGHIFPIPITLPVEQNSPVGLDKDVALRSPRNELLAVMTIEEVFEWDLDEAALKIFGTRDLRHPLVAEMHQWGRVNIAGKVRVLQLPPHYDFQDWRLTPAQARARLEALGKRNVVAFQTRNPLHRAHEELTKRACDEVDGVLLLHPVVGMTKPGDVDHYTRVRAYKALAQNHYDARRIVLSLLPLAMRFAGPREALWHALIRRNYGANHLIIGRDHASPGKDSSGQPFYDPYEAQAMVEGYRDELGVAVVPFREFGYNMAAQRYEEVSVGAGGIGFASISGSKIRDEYLTAGQRPPEWLARPVVAEILADAYPPKHRQGFCLWLTGFISSGKSTTAEVVTVLLMALGRQVTILDGDVIRTHLSKGLGFGKVDRDTNVRRVGFVASEIVRHGGAVVCALVSPYRATRDEVRAMVGSDHFVEILVDTPLEVCEQRDSKGLYARARRGEVAEVTGLDDPYEPPVKPEMVLDTVLHSAEENAQTVVDYLIEKGFVREAQPAE